MATHQTPARRRPTRINTQKRATAAISSSSRDSHNSGRFTPSSIHSESEFESDNELFRSISRRSKRNRPVDPYRELVVLHPSDDISNVLGIYGTDLVEFLDMCNEGAEWGFGAVSNNSMGETVYTPLVATLKNAAVTMNGKDGTRNSKKLPPRVCSDPTLRPDDVFERLKQPKNYFEYEIDDEDEYFLSQLADVATYSSSARSSKKAAAKAISGTNIDPVTTDQLEIIFSLLERELEIARAFRAQLDFVKEQYSSLLNMMRDVSDVLATLSKVDDTTVRKMRNHGEVKGRVSRSTVNKNESKKNTVRELSYRSTVVSEALEICSRHFDVTAGSIVESSASVSAPSSAANLDAESASSMRRRGRPPLHERTKELNCELKGAVKADHKDEDDPEYNLPPFYSIDELREMVPWDVAESVIQAALPEFFGKMWKASASTQSSVEKCSFITTESSLLHERSADTRLMLSPAYRVYEYWLSRRSLRRTSFLRGFHVFLMENWKVTGALETPVGPNSNESLKSKLLESRQRLLRLRVDLDRARLIMDLVRKREKMKKMVFRNTSDTFDEAFIVKSSETSDVTPVQKKKKSGTPSNVSNTGTNVLAFYHDAASCEDEISENDSEYFSDDYDDISEDGAAPLAHVKRRRSNGDTMDGENFVHEGNKVASALIDGNKKRTKTQHVTEPVLARLPLPSKNPLGKISSCSAISMLSHKSHSANKAATPCSLQNASISRRHSSSSSLSSTGSNSNDHMRQSATPYRNVRLHLSSEKVEAVSGSSIDLDIAATSKDSCVKISKVANDTGTVVSRATRARATAKVHGEASTEKDYIEKTTTAALNACKYEGRIKLEGKRQVDMRNVKDVNGPMDVIRTTRSGSSGVLKYSNRKQKKN